MPSEDTLTVDCATCVARSTAACGDCLVTFICDRRPEEAVVLSLDEVRTMRLLADAGLVPSLRHSERSA